MAEEQVIASKLVNALVRQARLEPSVIGGLGGAAGLGGDTDPLLRMFGRFQGGWWVGGRLTLTSRRLRFVAHALNRIVRIGPMEVDLALREVVGVSVRRGLVFDIVAVVLPGAELWVQCVGAEEFAAQLTEAIRRI